MTVEEYVYNHPWVWLVLLVVSDLLWIVVPHLILYFGIKILVKKKLTIFKRFSLRSKLTPYFGWSFVMVYLSSLGSCLFYICCGGSFPQGLISPYMFLLAIDWIDDVWSYLILYKLGIYLFPVAPAILFITLLFLVSNLESTQSIPTSAGKDYDTR